MTEANAPPGLLKDAQVLLMGLTPADAEMLTARLVIQAGDDPEGIVAAAWLMGATAFANLHAGRRICRICGCWELAACQPSSCAWVEPNLCSCCKDPTQHFAGLREEGAFWGDGDGDPFATDFPQQFDDVDGEQAEDAR